MSSVRPRLFLYLATPLLGLFLGLILAEFWARSLHPNGTEALLFDAPAYSPEGLYRDQPGLGLVPTPGFQGRIETLEYSVDISINQLGLRHEELKRKREDELRVLALGDSFTLGLQVSSEQHFLHQLGESLSKDLGKEVQLLNAGVDGYGTVQATQRLEQLGPELDLDAVLLTFFVGNDLLDNARQLQPELLDPPSAPPPSPGLLQRFLARHSTLYAWIQVIWKARHPDPTRLEQFKKEMAIFGADGPAALDAVLPLNQIALQEFSRRCAQLRLPCLVALAPPAFSVYPDRLRPTLALVDLPGPGDPRGPWSTLRYLLPSELRVKDLHGSLLQAASGPEPLYFTYDGHWTPAGHSTVAAALHEELKAMLSLRAP